MSDGGRESGRSNESSSSKFGALGGDDFGRAISRISVAQICESAGFHSFQGSALDSLTDILIQYVCDLCKTAHFYANLSGRTVCNVFDIIQALEDMGSLQGFPGVSDIESCLVRSGVVSEIIRFVNTTEEVPFTWPVPHFPIVRQCKSTPSFSQIGETPPGKHIPHWLPGFPDPHTYIHTPVWNERATDPRADKIEQARQRRKAERSLVSLQQRLARKGTAEPVAVDDGDIGKGKGLADSNPYLTPPLLFEEKDVSEVPIANEADREKKVSVLETFGPAIEAMKSGMLDSGVDERKVLPDRRPTVHFNVGIDKKSVATSLFSSSPSAGKKSSFFMRDDEKDDKKRRAEMILKESMENPHELTQL